MTTTMTSWDLFEDLRAAQDELLQATRGRGWRPSRQRHFAHDSAEEKMHRTERFYGGFRRSITLPSHVEADAQAAMDQTVQAGNRRHTPDLLAAITLPTAAGPRHS
jgi:hypothetical protein